MSEERSCKSFGHKPVFKVLQNEYELDYYKVFMPVKFSPSIEQEIRFKIECSECNSELVLAVEKKYGP